MPGWANLGPAFGQEHEKPVGSDMGRLATFGGMLRRNPRLRCSFCRREADAVARLVAGASAHMCDGCITKCVAVLQQQGGSEPQAAAETAPGR